MDKWLAIEKSKEKRSAEDSATASTSCLCPESQEVPRKRKATAKRKYSENYLKYGFYWNEDENDLRPSCVIFREQFSNHSMKPSLLLRHFQVKHASLAGKPLEFFERKRNEMKTDKRSLHSFTTINKQAMEASYLVSLRIAQTAKPHTIGESLILPAAKDIVFLAAAKLNIVSLSDNTVSRRINEIATQAKQTLIENIKQSKYFAIQFDESTDVTNFAQLMAYIRFERESVIDEEFLFCEPLPNHTTADEIFKKINEFITGHNIIRKKCIGVCADGARAITGCRGGVFAKIKEVAPDAKFTHCSIHREALATKTMPPSQKNVLDQSVKIVNFIKCRALNSRLFTILCNEMGSDHKRLLLHTEVRWLSRGKVLARLFELRSEAQVFLIESKFELRHCFTDELWLSRLAYLSDIFGKLNDLNSSLQGYNITVFTVRDKINAFLKKLEYIIKNVKSGNIASLPTQEEFLQENSLSLTEQLIEDVQKHCIGLVDNFNSYFPENLEKECWIRYPFSISDTMLDNLSVHERDELIGISCDGSLMNEFKKDNLCSFWLKRRDEYKYISDKAIKFLMPFNTSYLCETGFSAMLLIKNKYRTRLQLEPDLRLKLMKIKPDISKLVSNKQAHSSH